MKGFSRLPTSRREYGAHQQLDLAQPSMNNPPIAATAKKAVRATVESNPGRRPCME